MCIRDRIEESGFVKKESDMLSIYFKKILTCAKDVYKRQLYNKVNRIINSQYSYKPIDKVGLWYYDEYNQVNK